MKFARRLRALCLLVYLGIPGVCIAQQDNDYFSKLPANTVYSLLESVDGFTPIVCEVSGKTNDTIWAENLVQPPMWKIQVDMNDESVFVLSQNKKGKKAYMKNASYPKDAMKKGKEGLVEATCIVEKDGSLTDIKIIRSVFPSIDAEALRLFSEIRLLPCKIGEKPLRCKHKIALLFEIVDKKTKYGRALVVNPKNLPDGVAKKFQYGVRWTRTTTETKTDKYGFKDSRSWTSGSWHTALDIDVPKNNTELEKVLCQILYHKIGKSIEASGPKFAKRFKGKIKGEEFKKIKGSDLSITAHCLSYKVDKYYSYGYETTIKKFSVDRNGYTIAHNFIYDIQANRLLTIADIFTEDYIKSMGLDTEEKYDLGINDFFLYVGKNKKNIITVSLTQENWYKFSPIFHSLLGHKHCFPVSINEDDYLYESKLGIQPTKIKRKILNKPSLLINNEDFFHYINKNIIVPKSIAKTQKSVKADISFIVERDGTLSNLSITQTDEETELRDELMRIFDKIPQCQPLTLSGETVRSFNMLEYKLSFVRQSPTSSRK